MERNEVCCDRVQPEMTADDVRRLQAFGCLGAKLRRDYRHLPMNELERVVVSLLKPSRVAHVLGCRDTAAELARLWGVDEKDAARAGLLHDITKALDGPLQLTLCREYGIVLDVFSNRNPKTLHALTGSLVAERVFGENQAVVDAIISATSRHTSMRRSCFIFHILLDFFSLFLKRLTGK